MKNLLRDILEDFAEASAFGDTSLDVLGEHQGKRARAISLWGVWALRAENLERHLKYGTCLDCPRPCAVRKGRRTKHCEVCLERIRRHAHTHVDEGLCMTCTRPRELRNGRLLVLCEVCRLRREKRAACNRAALTAYKRSRVTARLASGLCARCPGPRAVKNGKQLRECVLCLEKRHKQRQAA